MGYETLSGIAPEAVAFVESGDPERGIFGDGSLLVLRKGEQTLTLMSPELPKRDRAAALKAYEDLGRLVVAPLTSPALTQKQADLAAPHLQPAASAASLSQTPAPGAIR